MSGYDYDAPELGDCGIAARGCAECSEDVAGEWRGVQLCERHLRHRIQDARKASQHLTGELRAAKSLQRQRARQ